MDYSRLTSKLLGICEVRTHEPMSAHTTFKIGGPADLFCLPNTVEALTEAVTAARADGAPLFILGGGSNLLVRDGGIRGVVISTAGLNGIRDLDGVTIEAGCGAMLARLASYARDKGLSGLEFAQGIPGSVGGGVVMNAGAYGSDISGVVLESEYLNRDNQVERLGVTEHGFGYRASFFTQNSDAVLLKTRFRFKRGNVDEISKIMSDYRERRRTMQPLDYPSAGSAFKRPPGMFAGKLIADAGLKGYRIGGAQVSDKHAGFIVNTGSATASDVLELLTYVKEQVFREQGVMLEQEIKVAGEG